MNDDVDVNHGKDDAQWPSLDESVGDHEMLMD